MTRAASLTLIALGAILAIAVHGHLPFLNVQVVRRRIVRKRDSPGGQVTEMEERRYPPYSRAPR